jgi:hypothetical protein
LRIDHRQLDVSKNGGSKNHQLPALKSGNAGSCILHRINGFDQLNFLDFSGFQGFPCEAMAQAL